MFRRLLVALVLLLPVQFLWGAVASYCLHETEPAAFHVGHHAHHDTGYKEGEASTMLHPSQSAAGLDHFDCSQCHGSIAHGTSMLHGCAEPPVDKRFAVPPTTSYSARAERNIERPK